MCLILFSYKTHPKYKLIIAANRDEFYARETKTADFWDEPSEVLAGKDLEAGGTWMGVARTGRLSMLTNFRDPDNIKTDAPSRGNLVLDYLTALTDAKSYLTGISDNGAAYNGFNLMVGTADELYYYGNYQKGVHKVEPGIHGLSNALLDSPWPKVVKGKEKLTSITSGSFTANDLFDTLYDDIKAPDSQLPDTGVSKEWESMLSPMFIKSNTYGSRCSTVILVDKDDNLQFVERTYNVSSFEYSDKEFRFKVQ